jgi:hypothetical protein
MQLVETTAKRGIRAPLGKNTDPYHGPEWFRVAQFRGAESPGHPLGGVNPARARPRL